MPASGGRRHAEIAGAGLAGLATAAALAQRGWSVRVHEKGEELREIGAGIYLFSNALRALKAIGSLDDLRTRAEHIVFNEIRDHRNRLVSEFGPSDGRLVIAVRRDLHNVLARAATAAGAEIVTSSRVLAARPDGRLEFADGSVSDRADLVIGADGVYSAVRDSLGLARAIVSLRDGCGRHLIPRLDTDPVNRARTIWNGGRRLGVAPASPDEVYIFLCCQEQATAWRAQQPFDPAPWLQTHPWYRSQIERIPRHPEGRWLNFFDVLCHAWSAGRVALVGDAAHAMSPNLGQGACTALASAVLLADHLDRTPDTALALAAWEREMRPIAERSQRYSNLYGLVGTRWPQEPHALDLRTHVTRRFLVPLLSRRAMPIEGAPVGGMLGTQPEALAS
jgi:2-polyprenyl-6-methoxyphenol hydroxylase-like FAD-dependent oxidoreductase